MVTALVSVGGSALCLVLGWSVRRVVSGFDIAIARLQERLDAEERSRASEDAAERERLQSVSDRIKDHEAAHMYAGQRLDRPPK